MIAKTVKPAIMKVQADNREELVALIEAAEGFQQVGKIAKMSGVYVANLVQADYALPIYAAAEDEGEGEGEGGEGGEGGNTPSTPTEGGDDQQETPATLTAEEAAAYNTAKSLAETDEGYVHEGDPKPADFDEVVNQ